MTVTTGAVMFTAALPTMVTVGAVIVMVGPVIVTIAPLPFWMVIPVASLTITLAPVSVLNMKPPVGPGTSLMTSVFWPVVWKQKTCPGGGGGICASAGTSPLLPKKPPTQTG